MITSERMAAVDRNAEALGVPRKQLMESSGNAVAGEVRRLADPGATVAIVAGRGNNGGDALVAARFLDEYDVVVHLLGRPETVTTDIARENWEALQAAEYDTRAVTDSTALDLDDPDVVVDAMLGTGVTGALRDPAATAARAGGAAGRRGGGGRGGGGPPPPTAARAMNDRDATVLSVDVPSGIDADTGDAPGVAVEADHVVTFHDEKPGLAELDTYVTVADIGIPAAAEQFTGPGDLLTLDRPAESHKGDFGEVLVVGGGPYTGAPALAAQAALRAGADLVRVACPDSVAREIQGFSENLILRPYDGERLTSAQVPEVTSLAAEHDVLVLGPGLGNHEETLAAVGDLLEAYDGTAVVDADALSVVPDVETEATLICTPHRGEFRRMGGEADDDWRRRADAVARFAADLGDVLLVKGPYDVISDGETTRVNRTGNPGMTVGGTGDVLAGATGALACVLSPLQAAAVGAYANGRAGDAAVEDAGHGLLATDLIDRLPAALWEEGQ
jgi:hydroxyethylthiazole kinase-like uncharacterized protein yjeF